MIPELITIERHITEQQRRYPGARGIFSALLTDIALAAKIIAHEIMHAGLNTILGASGAVNVHGEQQQKLDLFADQTLIRVCRAAGRLAAIASEENDDIIRIPNETGEGRYVLVYDPLDGSSNIDANVSTGTIFAIYRKITAGPETHEQDVLQPGRSLAAAGYIIYGPSTMFVYSTGQGVYGFTLDQSVGEFLLSHDDLRFPETPLYYSINQGYEKYWSEGVRRYVKWLQGMENGDRKPLGARYTGSLVMDFHRNLLNGGVFAYPGELHGSHPHGKLRLVYECIPLAFIAEQAGGYASNGRARILDLKPEHLHQRTPLFIGNRALVEQAERLIAEYDDR